MQYPFSLTPETLAAVETTISSPRFARFVGEAKEDRNLALRLYVWNGRLCEAFYLPVQFAEVGVRNAIYLPIQKRFGDNWYENEGFMKLLRPTVRDELERVVENQRNFRKSGLGPNHIVAALSLGFWLNFLTQAYSKQLWANGLRRSFPNLPRDIDQVSLYRAIDKLRRFRNRIAHHEAIFHRRPRVELENVICVIGWISSETEWLTLEISRVEQVLSRKPTV